MLLTVVVLRLEQAATRNYGSNDAMHHWLVDVTNLNQPRVLECILTVGLFGVFLLRPSVKADFALDEGHIFKCRHQFLKALHGQWAELLPGFKRFWTHGGLFCKHLVHKSSVDCLDKSVFNCYGILQRFIFS